MGYLVHIVLALAALAAAEHGYASQYELPSAIAALAIVPHALAWLTRKLLLAGRFRAAEVGYRALTLSSAFAYAAAVLAFGWLGSVERWTGAKPAVFGWPHASALLALAPFVLYALLSIDARARLSDARTDEIARVRRLHTRFLFSSLAPLVLFVLLTWAVGLQAELRAQIEYVALWGGAFALALIAATIVLLPRLLRWTWDTAPMPPGRARGLLEEFARSIGFRCRELVQWNTGFQIANAAVVGVGGGRIVLFSDLLLSQLPERELRAVFAHEVGHVVKHHVIVFVAWSAAFLAAADLGITALGLADDWVGVVLLIATLGLWYLAFGLLSRRTELEADLYSVGVTGDVEAMVSALERVGSPHTRALGSWRHFSTQKRVDFLRRAALEPWIAQRLSRRLRWIGRIGVALGLVAVVAEGWHLARSFREDRVAVELALGRYERASELAERLEEPDEELLALARRAATISDEQRTAEVLTKLGEEAFARTDLRAADELFSLARLRGAEGLDERIDELDEQLRTGSR